MFIAKWSNGIVMWSIPMCRSAVIPRTGKRFLNAQTGRIVKKTAAVITTATAKAGCFCENYTKCSGQKEHCAQKSRACRFCIYNAAIFCYNIVGMACDFVGKPKAVPNDPNSNVKGESNEKKNSFVCLCVSTFDGVYRCGVCGRRHSSTVRR